MRYLTEECKLNDIMMITKDVVGLNFCDDGTFVVMVVQLELTCDSCYINDDVNHVFKSEICDAISENINKLLKGYLYRDSLEKSSSL